ncbi:hypothetical protein RHGRI_025383 [Rhododendron griersonianum]|uniref:Oxidoreductase N-terminal domain-containing protein n=1 Tax=Rhododendron griersonianum TaxID=479676 RepID=A0AAV6IP12_9ERIC|nr:hypothetical protein RHGRI_025383 [Rhododendron griersonianum]
MAERVVEEVSNKQVILRDYVSGFPKESDFELRTSKIRLNPITGDGVARVIDSGHPNFKKGDLVWGMTGWEEYSLITEPETFFKIEHTDVPLSYYTRILVTDPVDVVQPIIGYGVARVIDSGHPNFKKGDLIWGMTGWEEYSLITEPETFFKIEHADVPLSYYTGILGKFILSFKLLR